MEDVCPAECGGKSAGFLWSSPPGRGPSNRNGGEWVGEWVDVFGSRSPAVDRWIDGYLLTNTYFHVPYSGRLGSAEGQSRLA